MRRTLVVMGAALGVLGGLMLAQAAGADDAPHPQQFQNWRLPAVVAGPVDNTTTPERVALGQRLFFDTHLSSDRSTACATCHDPAKGWSDGLPTAHGLNGKVLRRASPTVLNAAYNPLQMWDGRFVSLEEQVLGPMRSPDEMNTDIPGLVRFLRSDPVYQAQFARAYPQMPIDEQSVARAIAAFERTLLVTDTRFDRWLAGEPNVLSAAELRGLQVFMDPARGNCEVCHSAPNFTDNGFHNIGLASFGASDADPGRFAKKPVRSMQGAFKTPSLRGVTDTAPYFHDGSAATLRDVIEHYARGGDVKTNLSPNLKPLQLSTQEKDDLLAFLQSLAAPQRLAVMQASTVGQGAPP